MSSNNEHSKKRLYHLHIDLDEEYTPIEKRRKGPRLSMLHKENMRAQGVHHIDLWCDGSLYPKCPVKHCNPPFSTPTQLLKFAGDGYQGLLGYVNAHASAAQAFKHVLQQIHNEKLMIEAKCSRLEAALRAEQEDHTKTKEKLNKVLLKQTLLGARQRVRNIKNIAYLKAGSGGCKRRIQTVRYGYLQEVDFRYMVGNV